MQLPPWHAKTGGAKEIPVIDSVWWVVFSVFNPFGLNGFIRQDLIFWEGNQFAIQTIERDGLSIGLNKPANMIGRTCGLILIERVHLQLLRKQRQVVQSNTKEKKECVPAMPGMKNGKAKL